MSRAKHGETRRNDGFRVADARQVRVEALEKTVQILKRERDAARLDAERAQRAMRAVVASNDGLAKQRDDAQQAWLREHEACEGLGVIAHDLRAQLRAQRQELEAARAERLTWWDRLVGRVA